MADWQNPAQAREVFQTLCRALDSENWQYKKDEQAMRLECSARGDDLPMDITVKVDAERMLVVLFSHMPYVIPEDKRLDVAIAVSAINNDLVNGCFDYDITTGKMYFRMTNSIIESRVGAELFRYMVYCSCGTIDEYNDRFLMLGKGMLSLEQFLSAILN